MVSRVLSDNGLWAGAPQPLAPLLQSSEGRFDFPALAPLGVCHLGPYGPRKLMKIGSSYNRSRPYPSRDWLVGESLHGPPALSGGSTVKVLPYPLTPRLPTQRLHVSLVLRPNPAFSTLCEYFEIVAAVYDRRP